MKKIIGLIFLLLSSMLWANSLEYNPPPGKCEDIFLNSNGSNVVNEGDTRTYTLGNANIIASNVQWHVDYPNVLAFPNPSNLFEVEVAWHESGLVRVTYDCSDINGTSYDVSKSIYVTVNPIVVTPKLECINPPTSICSINNFKVTGVLVPTDYQWEIITECNYIITNSTTIGLSVDWQTSGNATIKYINTDTGEVLVQNTFIILEGFIWYYDKDGDGFGSTDGGHPPITSCTRPEGYVDNANDQCPDDFGCVNGCPANCPDRHWMQNESYNLKGKLLSKGRTYYNNLGKPTQSHSLDISTGKVWGNQVLYDSQGRPALTTLSAPSGNNFQYEEGFMRNENNNPYTSSDFEADPNNPSPSPVANSANTLGWYYSTANTDDFHVGNNYQDITEYPFSRTIYSKLNPGSVLKTLGGNKIDGNADGDLDDPEDQWLQGFSYTLPAAQEMYYTYGKDYFPNDIYEIEDFDFENIQDLPYDPDGVRCYVDILNAEGDIVFNHILSVVHHNVDVGYYYYILNAGVGKILHVLEETDDEGPATSWSGLAGGWSYFPVDINPEDYKFVLLKSFKTINIDIHGNESVVFTDAEGKTLAAAKSGNSDLQYEVLSLIGKQGYVDIHIPKNTDGNIEYFGNASDYQVWNLRTEAEPISPAPSYLEAGLYRIEALIDNYDDIMPALTYIDALGVLGKIFPSSMGVRYNVNYYDYTLNYYDKAGRLLETVQPKGFDDSNLLNGTFDTPNHTMKSEFEYNSLGQLLSTISPDEGEAKFKYRTDGQIRFSQNSKQELKNEVSYTNYDDLGRPIESGVVDANFSTLNPDAGNFTGLPKEQHFTVYDFTDEDIYSSNNNSVPYESLLPVNMNNLADLLNSEGIPLSDYQQSFVGSNVSITYTKNPGSNITWYSYDIYGRVKHLVQYIQALGVKTIDYVYDDVTGAVNQVIYQKNNEDEVFVHYYEYDSDTQQLVSVSTATEYDVTSPPIVHHAQYEYYETGALRSVDLLTDDGAQSIQGTDYVYNLAGQLKAINHPSLSNTLDPGGDETDLFGMVIDYYTGDYKRTPDFTYPTTKAENQFNGNIKSIAWNTNIDPNQNSTPRQYAYKYNTRNWLTEANFDAAGNSQGVIPNIELSLPIINTTHVEAGNSISMKPGFIATASTDLEFTARIVDGSNPFGVDDYKVSNINYDANGNIITLSRNKNTVNGNNAMDLLTYTYKADKPNQLDYVHDAVTEETGVEDIKDQEPNNYTYNSIGQLTHNESEGIDYEYNASGLVTKVYYNTQLRVEFIYDDKGKRLQKKSYNEGSLYQTTTYVRDASGSVMAIYENGEQKELPIYGASRLGIYFKDSETSVYQLTDHLGNVRALISKQGNNAAALVGNTDYYPFGMAMPNRQTRSAYGYRYEFQGQEKDPETEKEAFQLRLWDSRIGRWLTTDPKHTGVSPYWGMNNNPISIIDKDGGEGDWHWEGDTLVADEGDNVETLATFLDSTIEFAQGVLNAERFLSTPWQGKEYIFGGQHAYGDFSYLKPGLNQSFFGWHTSVFTSQPRSDILGYDYKKAVETLDANANTKSIGYCAKYVRLAIEGGGLSTNGRPGSAKDYDTYLPTLGFNDVQTSNYLPITGDIIVMEAFGTHVHGHIQMYNGNQWVSDFYQRDFWPGSSYRTSQPTYTIFR